MKQSRADERWSTIETFAKLGWSASWIAKLFDWSEGTIVSDISNRGGIKKLFPERPKGRKAYAATFQYYVETFSMIDRVKVVVEEYLNIPHLRMVIEAMERAGAALCAYRFKEEMRPFASLYSELMGLRWKSHDLSVDLFFDYQQLLMSGDLDYPESLDEALDAIDKIFVLSANRQRILVDLDSSDLDTYLLGLIDQYLTTRQRYVIEKRFGLDGGERQYLVTIGLELDLTLERVRQIEAKALYMLRKKLKEDGKRFFCTISDIKSSLYEAEKMILGLQTQITEMKKTAEAEVFERMRQMEQAVEEVAVYEIRVSKAGFSPRATNYLGRSGVTCLGQLIQCSEAELLSIHNIGRKSVNNIVRVLRDGYGLELDTIFSSELQARYPFPEGIKRSG